MSKEVFADPLCSVRSTNVHEEKSLGVYNDHEHDEEKEEDGFNNDGPRMQVWRRYLWMHARQQLAFGMDILPPFQG